MRVRGTVDEIFHVTQTPWLVKLLKSEAISRIEGKATGVISEVLLLVLVARAGSLIYCAVAGGDVMATTALVYGEGSGWGLGWRSWIAHGNMEYFFCVLQLIGIELWEVLVSM